MNCEVEDKQAINEGFVITVLDNTRNVAKKRKVIYNPSDYMVHCLCKMFECEGIPLLPHIVCFEHKRLCVNCQHTILYTDELKCHLARQILVWMVPFFGSVLKRTMKIS